MFKHQHGLDETRQACCAFQVSNGAFPIIFAFEVQAVVAEERNPKLPIWSHEEGKFHCFTTIRNVSSRYKLYLGMQSKRTRVLESTNNIYLDCCFSYWRTILI